MYENYMKYQVRSMTNERTEPHRLSTRKVTEIKNGHFCIWQSTAEESYFCLEKCHKQNFNDSQ